MTKLPTGEPSSLAGTGSAIFTLGGIAAAFGVASCCGLPFMLATAGLGSAWLGGLGLIAGPHRSLLLAVAVALLTIGALLFWRQRRVAACVPNQACGRPMLGRLTILGLLLGWGLLYLGYSYA